MHSYMNSKCTFFINIIGGIFFLYSCATDELIDYHSNSDFLSINSGNWALRGDSCYQGIYNAIRKAHQLTDIEFTPVRDFEYNTGSYSSGVSYKGVPYSSVKEIETYVGENVSFHTFMTAIQNPRSKLYTERINDKPYHGKNCKAYYGTVCSGLVSYALGLVPRFNSYDFPLSDKMEDISSFEPELLCEGDILWREGHVAMITGIIKDYAGTVKELEISESGGSRCKRYSVTRDYFVNTIMTNHFRKIYYYKELSKNIDYHPVTEFVAVDDEDKQSFIYNQDICVDKGDKSCYLENEPVVVNVLSEDAVLLEIYRNDSLYQTYVINDETDVVFDKLLFGDYKARIVFDMVSGQFSDYTYWKVVHADVSLEPLNRILYFHSLNSEPNQIVFCNINGKRPPMSEGYCKIISPEELTQGFVSIPADRILSNYPFVKVFFKTDFGTITSNPINWFNQNIK